jgi:hypothetical protein
LQNEKTRHPAIFEVLACVSRALRIEKDLFRLAPFSQRGIACVSMAHFPRSREFLNSLRQALEFALARLVQIQLSNLVQIPMHRELAAPLAAPLAVQLLPLQRPFGLSPPRASSSLGCGCLRALAAPRHTAGASVQ